jgi:hypothetical protein
MEEEKKTNSPGFFSFQTIVTGMKKSLQVECMNMEGKQNVTAVENLQPTIIM